MESIIDCYFDNIFTQMDRGCLIPRYKRRQIVDYFSTVIRACSTNHEEGCKKAVVAITKFHKKSKDNNGSVCLLGKYHNVLYVALKLCFDWKLNDHDTVTTVLIDLFSCEKTFERLMIGAIFGTRVTHLISGWKSDFQTRDECLQAVEYFLEHSARSKLKFEIGGRFTTMADIPMPSYGFSTPAKVCIQTGRFDFLKVLLRYGAEPVVVTNHNQCPLHLLLLRMHTLAESAIPGEFRNLLALPLYRNMLSQEARDYENHVLPPEDTSRNDYTSVSKPPRNDGSCTVSSQEPRNLHSNVEFASKEPQDNKNCSESVSKDPGDTKNSINSSFRDKCNLEQRNCYSNEEIYPSEETQNLKSCDNYHHRDNIRNKSKQKASKPHLEESQTFGSCEENYPIQDNCEEEAKNIVSDQETLRKEPAILENSNECVPKSPKNIEGDEECDSDSGNTAVNQEVSLIEPGELESFCKDPEASDTDHESTLKRSEDDYEFTSSQPENATNDDEPFSETSDHIKIYQVSVPAESGNFEPNSQQPKNDENFFKSSIFPEDLISCLQVFMDVIPQVPHTIFDNENEPTSLHPAVFSVIPRDRNGWTAAASLRHLCRCEIRKCLVPNGCLPYGIYELKLPLVVQRYVDMSD
ncbi:uncharacterized protein LOC111056762 [Nilaparvata lugens]|uniref:uncharacterized protein LOC111056762 n=1 Tax=Nilaparvata lugens TaxID=108931 RepID=UPI00193DFCE8|nr:uncharacterized protein LOC111056762 [Nilaparvata lugens]